jgi:hypothetical protein
MGSSQPPSRDTDLLSTVPVLVSSILVFTHRFTDQSAQQQLLETVKNWTVMETNRPVENSFPRAKFNKETGNVYF